MSSVASPRLIYTRALNENVPSFSGDEKNKQRKKKKNSPEGCVYAGDDEWRCDNEKDEGSNLE